MSSWKLIVEDYGKIKHAEIEAAPLTLFVGDNNSGKSYLMSLLWGIKSLGIEKMIGFSYVHDSYCKTIEDWIVEQIDVAREIKEHTVCIRDISRTMESFLNEQIKEKKHSFIKNIFNSDNISIGKLEIKFEDLSEETLKFYMNDNGSLIVEKENGTSFGLGSSIVDEELYKDNDVVIQAVILATYSLILDVEATEISSHSHVYLPAARTGFMLTKDIINKVGRQNTFNIIDESQTIAPFVRPINSFLDIMNDLSVEDTGEDITCELAQNIESEMAHGTVVMSSMPNKEVQYIPNGYDEGLPLRLVSAVVTEVSPLILIFKHKQEIKSLYYEEPEMCLHPQLQHKMGKVICRIVNSGIDMVITTHSDIILQHINNMIKLSQHEEYEQLSNLFDYAENDKLSQEQVKVYQLTNTDEGYTAISELSCGENGFVVPTFNNALNLIMDEAYEIQG